MLKPPKDQLPGEKYEYIPGLYIKSDWEPPTCRIQELETAMDAFEREFRACQL